MKDLYLNHGLSTWKIGKAMGYLNVCVINNLKKAGTEMRSRSDANKTFEVNRSYFDVIDTPTKAYILGFLYADGNMSKDSLTLALQERDKPTLEAIAKEIGYTGQLNFRKKQSVNKQNMWALRVHDLEFANSLRRIGIVPQKTSKVRFPTFLNPSLTYAFLHGLADGDGCVCTNRNTIHFIIAGAKGMVLDIKDILKRDLGLNLLFREKKGSRGTTGTLNGVNAIRFLHKMYKSGSNIALPRKRDKFTDFLSFKLNFSEQRQHLPQVIRSQVYIDIIKDLS